MPIRVNVPNVGVVNFPDGMPPDQITAEIEKLSQPARTPDRPQGLSTLGEQIRAKNPDDAAWLQLEFQKFDDANRRLNEATLGKVWDGGKRVLSGPTLDDRAGGLADMVIGGGTTAALMLGGPLLQAAKAAPLLAAGTVLGGAAVGKGAEMTAEALGAGEGTRRLAEVTGGVVGGAAGNAAMRPVSRGVARGFQNAGEYLYRKAGYADTPKAMQARMAAVSTNQAPPKALAREVMERNVSGDPVEAGAQLMQRLATLEPRLQASAGRRLVTGIKDREAVAATLEQLAADAAASPYQARKIPELTGLAAKMRSDAPLAADVLRAKRWLDSARLSGTYKLNPNMSGRQEDFQKASDALRSAFHWSDPTLSKLLNEERIAMQGLDAMIGKAVAQGKADIVQALDPMMAMAGGYAAGPVGVGAPLLRRGLKSSNLLTNAGQRLYQMGDGKFVPMPEELAMPRSVAALPAGARQMPPSEDPSFVRGVPAEYARRTPAGLLTPGTGAESGIPTRLGPSGPREPGGLSWFDEPATLRGGTYQPPQAPPPAAAAAPAQRPVSTTGRVVEMTANEARAPLGQGQTGRRVKIVPPATATPKAAPATAAATPARAAQHVTDELARVVNVDGARSAKDVQARVLAALNEELAVAPTHAGFTEATARRYGGGKTGTVTGYVDGTRVVDVDSLGHVRETGRNIPGFRDMGPKEQERAVAALAAKLAGDANKAGSVSIKIPGDGTFTIARNPHSLGEVIRRISSAGPSPWKGITKK